jgi:hypothetical protein
MGAPTTGLQSRLPPLLPPLLLLLLPHPPTDCTEVGLPGCCCCCCCFCCRLLFVTWPDDGGLCSGHWRAPQIGLELSLNGKVGLGPT